MINYAFFDLGGVAIDDFSGNKNWEDLTSEIGLTDQTREQFNDIWAEHRHKFCLDMSMDEFLKIAQEKMPLDIPDNYDLLEAFTTRFKPNESIWPILAEFQEDMNIGLITNLYPGMFDSIVDKGIMPPDIRWDVIIDSSKVGLQKPDPAIFNMAISRINIRPSQVLFVDNTSKHLESARELGIQTLLYNSSDKETSNAALISLLNSQRSKIDAAKKTGKNTSTNAG